MSTHLVIGAGPVGSEVARLLAGDGHDVVVVTRHGSGPNLAGVRLVSANAVDFGLQRTGRIITAAALPIAIVFAAFLTSGATNITQLGLGVTVAILLDATIVRALLVPAFMRTADGASWWAPSWLRKVHQRVGLHDG